MKHTLQNKELNKVFVIELSDLIVTYHSGKVGKLRTYNKEFKTAEDAQKFFDKKEWEMLKKGFVFNDSGASVGESKLHYFTSSGYSGCLSFADTPEDGLFIYQQGSYDDPKDSYDFIVNIDKLGELKRLMKLPEILPWDIKYNESNNSLLIDLDHHIYCHNIKDQRFEKIADREQGDWGSFISVSENAFGYGTNEKLTIKDFENKTIFNQSYKVENSSGNTVFCSVLSKTKNILAIHTKVGEISLFDTITNQPLEKITGDFEIVDKLEFVSSDNVLVIKTYYPGPLQYFDLEKGTFIEFPMLEIPAYTKDVNDFCFNKEGSKLVVVQRTTAYVFDFVKKELLHQFAIKHTIKRGAIKFVGEDLGVRTDYGCFSLYKV